MFMFVSTARPCKRFSNNEANLGKRLEYRRIVNLGIDIENINLKTGIS